AAERRRRHRPMTLPRGLSPDGNSILRAVRICLASRPVTVVRLVAPDRPPRTGAAREQFEIGTGRTCLDDVVLFVGLARVLALAARQQIDLAPARSTCARVLAVHTEQNELGNVAKVETDATAVRAAVPSYLVPNEIRFVLESPRAH